MKITRDGRVERLTEKHSQGPGTHTCSQTKLATEMILIRDTLTDELCFPPIYKSSTFPRSKMSIWMWGRKKWENDMAQQECFLSSFARRQDKVHWKDTSWKRVGRMKVWGVPNLSPQRIRGLDENDGDPQRGRGEVGSVRAKPDSLVRHESIGEFLSGAVCIGFRSQLEEWPRITLSNTTATSSRWPPALEYGHSKLTCYKCRTHIRFEQLRKRRENTLLIIFISFTCWNDSFLDILG